MGHPYVGDDESFQRRGQIGGGEGNFIRINSSISRKKFGWELFEERGETAISGERDDFKVEFVNFFDIF